MTESRELLDALCRHAVEILDSSRGPISAIRLRAGELAVEVERPVATAPVVATAPAAVPMARLEGISSEQAETEPETEDGTSVCSPTVGTFYRSPEPGAEPFVREGDLVEAGQQVAILEAMKLMNPIEADQAGRVTKILVPDGESVEYGQPLLVIAPAA